MFELTPQQRIKALIWLSFFHILIITSSNYLVKLPITIFGFHTTWGAFTFPFIFLTTDLTVRIYGASLARRIIAAAMLPALSVSYILSALFYQGQWQGFITLNEFNLFVARIAPTAAMFFGNLLDTIPFFFIAFYRSTDPFMAINWIEIALVDYSFNLFICMLFFLPAYGLVLNFILSYFFHSQHAKNYDLASRS